MDYCDQRCEIIYEATFQACEIKFFKYFEFYPSDLEVGPGQISGYGYRISCLDRPIQTSAFSFLYIM